MGKMAGVKALVALAFSGSIGLLFLFLACALPQFNNWIPFTVVIFYLISPIPTLIAKRRGDDSSGSNPCRELAWFLTTGIVVSAFALPIVLSRAPVAVTPAPLPPNSTTTTTPGTNTTPQPSLQTTTVVDFVMLVSFDQWFCICALQDWSFFSRQKCCWRRSD